MQGGRPGAWSPGCRTRSEGSWGGEGLAGAEGEDAAGGGEELVAVGAVVAVRGHNFRLLLSPEALNDGTAAACGLVGFTASGWWARGVGERRLKWAR